MNTGHIAALDLYQLTTLVAHFDAGRIFNEVEMNFFFRRMPKNRNFVVACGIEHALERLRRIKGLDFRPLLDNPHFNVALMKRPNLLRALHNYKGFSGSIWAVAEGTPLFAGPGYLEDGSPFMVKGSHVRVYEPMMHVKTDLLSAKLIETPTLSYLNHLSMVASKAARVAIAAKGKQVLEFGSRRTHPWAAIDAAYAAYVGGCDATSNVAAGSILDIPTAGTMDHFMVMAREQEGYSKEETELKAFEEFYDSFPDNAIFLVDTYNIAQGIKNAVKASKRKLKGIRIDSNVSIETLKEAKAMLILLGAPDTKIFVSDGLDEFKVDTLTNHADGFGVGENIVCSPDSSVGIGAVAKLTTSAYGVPVMKFSEGSGKMTLPGHIEVYRSKEKDLLALHGEEVDEDEFRMLLMEEVWADHGPYRESPRIADTSRRLLQDQLLNRLPKLFQALRSDVERHIVVSKGLAALITRLAG